MADTHSFLSDYLIMYLKVYVVLSPARHINETWFKELSVSSKLDLTFSLYSTIFWVIEARKYVDTYTKTSALNALNEENSPKNFLTTVSERVVFFIIFLLHLEQ